MPAWTARRLDQPTEEPPPFVDEDELQMHGFDDYLTKDQAAEVLNVKTSLLDVWRWNGRGPTYVRAGKTVRYSRAALKEFIAQNTRLSIENEMRLQASKKSPVFKERSPLSETTEQRKARLKAQRDRGGQIRRDLQAKWDIRSKKKTGYAPNASTPAIDVQD